MGLFYTGQGDQGESKVWQKKIPKDSLEMAALGNLDELNSLLGLIGTQKMPSDIPAVLKEIQENLFIIQANTSSFNNEGQAPKLAAEKVVAMEKLIDAIEEKVQPRRGFVVPGQTESSAWLDLARTVARRAERSVVAFSRTADVDPVILAYLNRLSGLLFGLGRLAVKDADVTEQNPTYR